MKYCNNCQRITIGDPVFCNFCGRSYRVRYCPRLHPNPRAAEVCSQCGSRELSSPAPDAPLRSKLTLFLLTVFPGIALLLALVVYVVAFLNRLANNANAMQALMLVGLVLALLFWLWMQLPQFLKHGVTRLFKGSKTKHEHSRH
jgi:RNA polymerase subunit RPABC4/transcription elongation factor Spt4